MFTSQFLQNYRACCDVWSLHRQYNTCLAVAFRVLRPSSSACHFMCVCLHIGLCGISVQYMVCCCCSHIDWIIFVVANYDAWTGRGESGSRKATEFFNRLFVCVCVRPRCFLLHRNVSVFGFPSFLHVCFSLVIQHRRFSVNSFSRHLINGKTHTSWQTSSFAQRRVRKNPNSLKWQFCG